MILSAAFRLISSIISWLFSALGSFLPFPTGFIDVVVSFITRLVNGGAGFLFLFVRPATFYAAIDILFFLYTFEPLYYFIRWVLRKLPFINIS